MGPIVGWTVGVNDGDFVGITVGLWVVMIISSSPALPLFTIALCIPTQSSPQVAAFCCSFVVKPPFAISSEMNDVTTSYIVVEDFNVEQGISPQSSPRPSSYSTITVVASSVMLVTTANSTLCPSDSPPAAMSIIVPRRTFMFWGVTSKSVASSVLP